MGIFDTNYDFNKYKFFYAVATCKSFSKAAELMHISQPAISYSIKELEEQLNVKLFIRNKNGVVLTEDAEKLLSYVKRAFDNLLMIEDVLNENKQDLSGTVRIGIYSHISLFLMPNSINDFKKIYPNANFYIYSTSHKEMIDKLKNKELDLLILQYPILFDNDDFNEEILFEAPTCFFGNKKYYELYLKNGNSINNMPVALPIPGYNDIDSIKENLKENNMELDQKLTSYSTELSKVFAKEGLGISWGVKKCIEKEIKDKSLYELPVNFKLPITRFSMVYNPNFINNTTKKFIDYLKENIDKYTKI